MSDIARLFGYFAVQNRAANGDDRLAQGAGTGFCGKHTTIGRAPWTFVQNIMKLSQTERNLPRYKKPRKHRFFQAEIA